MCPTEFKCAVFADGELPEAEAREIAMHLDSCLACSTLVSKLQAESRMFVQSLQDVDLAEEFVPVFEPPKPVGIGRFAFGIVGVALAFRLSTGILFGLELPFFLDPKTWFSGIRVAFDAVLFAIQNGEVAVANTVQAVALISLGGLALAGMARALRHGPAIGALLSVFVAVGFFSTPSYAIDVRKGAAASLASTETVDDTLVVRPGEDGKDMNKDINVAGTVKGDLIAFGDTVTVSGTVDGSVLAFARRVEVTGTVTGSVFLAGGALVVSGKVGGSVVAAGSDLRISGEIARNYAGFGANLNMAQTSMVGGNVTTFGAESVIDGIILKDLYSSGAITEMRGSARNVDFKGAQIRLTRTARVGGNLSAKVPKEINVMIDSGAVVSGNRNITLEQRRPSQYSSSSYYFWQIVRLVTAFITGWLIFRFVPWLAPTRVGSGLDWLKAGGLGLAFLVTVPVAVIIALCTVVGIPLALLTLVIWIAALYFAKIIVAEFVGRMLFKKSNAVSLLAGLAIVIVAVNLPMLGGLISFLLLLLGLGALVMTAYRMSTTPRLAEI
jgi:cytoskeletal protein CcmA (bactofilin family)